MTTTHRKWEQDKVSNNGVLRQLRQIDERTIKRCSCLNWKTSTKWWSFQVDNSIRKGAIIIEQTVTNLRREIFLAATLGGMYLVALRKGKKNLLKCFQVLTYILIAHTAVISKSKLFSMRALCLCIWKIGSTLMKTSFQRVLPIFHMRNQNLGQDNKSAGWMPWH